MDGEEVMMGQKTLPEALVEKIIARMPFPSIFKARCLSKSWLARFSSISSLHVDEEKWLATLFQEEVSKWSNNWDTFSPVLMCTEVEDFVAYKRASQNWSRIPSPSFLPFHTDLQTWQIEGPLLYGFFHPKTRTYHTGDVFVANVLTRSWRQLPPRPDALVTTIVCHNVVVDPSSGTYKVILVIKFCPQKAVDHYCAQIFDSKLDGWSSNKNFEVSTDLSHGVYDTANLNGVVYMVTSITPLILLAFNLEEGAVEEITLSSNNDDVLWPINVNLVVCNGDWLILVTGHEDTDRCAMQVFKIDLGDRRLVPLAMSPRECPHSLGFHRVPPTGDGNCVLFWKVDLDDFTHSRVGKWSRMQARKKWFRVVTYNVDEDVWTTFHVPETTVTRFSETKYRGFGSSFRPGLSPFVEV